MIHGELGGSRASQHLNCPASVKLSRKYPSTAGAAAARGGVIHWLLEMLGLDPEFDVQSHLGTLHQEDDKESLEINQDHIDTALDIWAATERFYDEYKVEDIIPETTGFYDRNRGILSTADQVITGTTPEGKSFLGVLDFKSGSGVQVGARDNKQILHNFLTLSTESEVLDLFQDLAQYDTLMGIIIQPSFDGEVHVRTWEFNLDTLNEFINQYLAAVDIALEGESEPNPGKHCTFCNAASYCPARLAQANKFLSLDPMVQENVTAAMDLIPLVREHINRVEDAAFDLLEKGHTLEGYKLVQRRGTNHWVDPEAARHTLRYARGVNKDMYIEEKMRTAPQVKKALQKAGLFSDKIEALMSNESTGTTVVPESDKREAVKVKPAEVPDNIKQLFTKKIAGG